MATHICSNMSAYKYFNPKKNQFYIIRRTTGHHDVLTALQLLFCFRNEFMSYWRMLANVTCYYEGKFFTSYLSYRIYKFDLEIAFMSTCKS